MLNRDTQKRTLSIWIFALVMVVGIGTGIWAALIKDSPSNTTDNWVTVTTDHYNVKIPDGWVVNVFTAHDIILDGDCVSCLKYSAGKRAKILKSDWKGEISGSNYTRPFTLKPQAVNETETEFFSSYNKIGSIAAKNALGNKYYKKITAAKEMGLPEGSITYGYAFTKGETVIFITHSFGPNGKDRHDVIEKLIPFLELK